PIFHNHHVGGIVLRITQTTLAIGQSTNSVHVLDLGLLRSIQLRDVLVANILIDDGVALGILVHIVVHGGAQSTDLNVVIEIIIVSIVGITGGGVSGACGVGVLGDLVIVGSNDIDSALVIDALHGGQLAILIEGSHDGVDVVVNRQ